jgi:UDP-N-acetylmuramoylalanine--D-glutamate ligase
MQMAAPGKAQVSFGLDPAEATGEYGLVEAEGRTWLTRESLQLFDVADLPLAGRHNAANAMAALALCEAIGLDPARLLPALGSFQGLPHRVEKVAQIHGVTWYDDSKGTNVGATVAALRGFSQPVLLIAGGDGKGQDFTPLRDALGHARAVVLIGRDAPALAAALKGSGVPIEVAPTMEAAVAGAHALARPGDAVLLSPACASFDMFRNYSHRGAVFAAAARSLAAKEGR